LKLSLAPIGLDGLDDLRQDTLLLDHFLEDRPLVGLTGHVDWRMNGRLSRHVLKDWAIGRDVDVVLMPGGVRMGVHRIVLVGLGHLDEFDLDRFKAATRRGLEALVGMQVTRFATGLPGDRGLKTPSRKVIEAWLEVFEEICVSRSKDTSSFDVTFVVEPNQVGDLTESLGDFEARYRAVDTGA
jgi:hypothetical protein